MQSTLPGVFFGGDAAWGPENIIWAVEHGHQAAISIHTHCPGASLTERPPTGMNLVSAKLGMHAWRYSNDYNPAERAKMQHVELVERFRQLDMEVELGFTAEQTAREVERCLNCDVQTHFTAPLCIECDACVDVCPVSCLTIARTPTRRSCARGSWRPPCTPTSRSMSPSRCRRRPPDGEGRGRLPALRAVRGALPDGAWDMAGDHADTTPASSCGAAHAASERLRLQDRHRERHRLGQREQPAHAGDLPDGDPGFGQERLPLQHPGAAHLVRDPGEPRRLHRAHPPLRPVRGDEPRHLRARRRRGGARRLPALRLLLAAEPGAPAGRRPPSSASRSGSMCVDAFSGAASAC